MARLLLAIGLLLTPWVASSILNEETGCDDCIEAEYISNDYGCPLYWNPYQGPEIPYGGSTPVGIGNPFALPAVSLYSQVPPNYGRLPPFYAFPPSSKPNIQNVPYGQNPLFPYNSVNSEVGTGLSIVNDGNTEIISDCVDSCGGTAEDLTSWYPHGGAFLYSPGYDDENVFDNKYIKVPYTNVYGYPELDRNIDGCYPKDMYQYQEYQIPPLYQGSSTRYDYGYGLFNPQQTFSKYAPNFNQYGCNYESFPPTLYPSTLPSATTVQDGYPRTGYGYPKQTSELSSTAMVHNGYATNEDYKSSIKNDYQNENYRPEGLGYELYNTEQITSKIPYSTVAHQKEYPIKGFSSQTLSDYPKLSSLYGFENVGLSDEDLSKVQFPAVQSQQKKNGNGPYIPTQGNNGYEQLELVGVTVGAPSSEQAINNEDVTSGINLFEDNKAKQLFPQKDRVKLPSPMPSIYELPAHQDHGYNKVNDKQENAKRPIELPWTEYSDDYNTKEQAFQGIGLSSSDYPNQKLSEINPASTDSELFDYYGSNRFQFPGGQFKSKQVPGFGKQNGYTTNGIYNYVPGSPYRTDLYGPPAALSLEVGVSASVPGLDPSEQLIKLFDGCSVTQGQLEDIIKSFLVPEECILTVPQICSGPLDQFAHVMDCFPDSVDANDAFVHLPCDLLVPYYCYKHIASIYASDLPLFQETSGVILSNGELVDFHIVASIVACSRTPDCLLIITSTNLAIPYDIFKNYMNKITPEDRKNLRILLPGVKEPIQYDTFKIIFDLYVGKFNNNTPHDKNKSVKLLGSKIELTLEQFLSVMENYRGIKNAMVTLPSKKSMPLTSFLPLAHILGDEYTRTCIINIPNTPCSLPFNVVREIIELYIVNNKFDLSKDTDVNWNFEKDNLDDVKDVEIFSLSPKYISSENSAKESVSILNGEIASKEPQYLLCQKKTPPYYNFYNVGGIGEPEGREAFDKRNLFNPYSKLVNDLLKVQKSTLNLLPVGTEPVYACERFEKHNSHALH